MNEKIEKLKTSFQEAKNKLIEDGKVLFHEALSDVFEKHPKLNSFGWKQYTPYWNDGEPCTFGLGQVEEINGYEDNSYDSSPNQDEGGEGYNPWNNISISWKKIVGNPEADSMVKDLNGFIDQFPLEVMEALFGDHSSVKIYRNGKVERQNYDHE